MSFRRCLGVTALMSTVFLFGCAETGSIEDLREPGIAPKTGGGTSGGTNGGSIDDNHALEAAMIQATSSALVQPGTMKVHQGISAGLLAQPGGAGIFKYAVRCGLDKHVGEGFVTSGLQRFYGLGHLTTTSDWLSGPLSQEGRNDLFACILTLMNGFGVEVKVVLEGKDVHDDGLDHSDFDFREAAWVAEAIGNTVYYTIWPTEEFLDDCDDNPVSVFETRVCGNFPGVCNATLGGTFEAHCQELATGGTFCDGKNAIVTYLKYTDRATLYPTCEW
jgi:hypothetical protein